MNRRIVAAVLIGVVLIGIAVAISLLVYQLMGATDYIQLWSGPWPH